MNLLSKLRTTTQPPALITGWPTGLTERALGEQVIDWVTTHPELHDQRRTTHGHQACLAGWAIALHHGVRDGSQRQQIDLFSNDPSAVAAKLLGLSEWKFAQHVYTEMNEHRAISNLKQLIDA